MQIKNIQRIVLGTYKQRDSIALKQKNPEVCNVIAANALGFISVQKKQTLPETETHSTVEKKFIKIGPVVENEQCSIEMAVQI